MTYDDNTLLEFVSRDCKSDKHLLDIIKRSSSVCETEDEMNCRNAIPRLCGDRNCICLYPYFGGSKTFDHGGDSRIMRPGDIG